jgi:hypothetical protein
LPACVSTCVSIWNRHWNFFEKAAGLIRRFRYTGNREEKRPRGSDDLAGIAILLTAILLAAFR